MTKIAMIRLEAALLPDARIILTVHDEIVVEAPTDQAATIQTMLPGAMRAAGEALIPSVPIVVEAHTEACWKK